MTYTIHGTRKLLARVKRPLCAQPETATTFLGNWYATALFWRPQLALLINERTLLPVLMPLAPAVELAQRFPEHLAQVLRAHETPPALIAHELEAMRSFQYCKTASRSLLGMLNQFTYVAEVDRDYHQITDLVDLSLKLSEMPCRPLYKSGIAPDRELRKLIGGEWSAALEPRRSA